jgi:PAS domain S-box-containing protein
MNPLDAEDAFAEALANGWLGLALLDDTGVVLRRLGRLSDWLPPEGDSACASPLLLNFEESFAALRRGGGEIVLPSMRLPAQSAARANIAIRYRAARREFLVVTTPDYAADQIDRLLAPERREKQVLQQQAEAARARLRAADALYRDMVESSGYFVLRFGVDLKVIYANRHAAEFLGAPQDALVGRAIGDLFPPIAGDDPWRLDMASAAPISFEAPAYDARGALRWLGWSVRFIGEEGGGEFQAVARDATASRRLRAERAKAREEARAAAIANERLRIAHDLHDTLVRSIVATIAQVRVIARTTTDAQARTALRELESQARSGLQEAREAIAQMRKSRREDIDLRAIVKEFAAQRHGQPPTVETQWEFDEAALPHDVQELCARVLRESLRNIELHAGASHVRVRLTSEGEAARLTIEDDGVGFDPDAPTPDHFGVAGMRERASATGATLEIESGRGKGARVSLVAPLKA